MLELLTNPNAWAALVTLSALEVVLGIDNIVFISLLVSRLDPTQAERARRIGLFLAFFFRVALLFSLTWLMHLREPLFTVFNMGISWRDVILIGGGLFLVAKATHEIHHEMEAAADQAAGISSAVVYASFGMIVLQIALIDLVFSIDSIITAIGMVDEIAIMIAAVLIAIVIMYLASGPVAGFIERHPTTKMLALAFLVLIGVALIADGFEVHIPRGYIYFAMAFAASVETVNVMVSRRRTRGRRKATRQH